MTHWRSYVLEILHDYFHFVYMAHIEILLCDFSLIEVERFKSLTWYYSWYYSCNTTQMDSVVAWGWSSSSSILKSIPDSKVHEANMGPTLVLSAPDGPHFGPMNLATWDDDKYHSHLYEYLWENWPSYNGTTLYCMSWPCHNETQLYCICKNSFQLFALTPIGNKTLISCFHISTVSYMLRAFR